MRIHILVIASVVQLASGAARAESLEATQKRVEQLESEVRELRARIDNLGPVAGAREIRTANPVFLGEESMGPSQLAMDDPAINCPAQSFVAAIQILKTGNTVTQIRYACRGLK